MSLINYVEPISIGGIFVGFGSLILTIVLAFIALRLYMKVADWLDTLINREVKYGILEEKYLDGIAKKKGIDLDKELAKRVLFNKPKKSFRKKLEEQVFDEMFGKDKKIT